MAPKQTLQAAAESLPVDFIKSIQATGLQMVSPRSIRFDIPLTAAGVNRIKITLQENGEWRMRTYKVEELEDVPGIKPESLMGAIKTLAMEGQP